MHYWLNLFTPETWHRFQMHGSNVTGFPAALARDAGKVAPGDRFVCYMLQVSRFCGVLRVDSSAYEDHSSIFEDVNDRFFVRFRVSPETIVPLQHAVPVTADEVWHRLTWTRGRARSTGWGNRFRTALREFPLEDAEFLADLLRVQALTPKPYPLTEAHIRVLRVAGIRVPS